MNIRENYENIEEQILSEKAVKSKYSKGRVRYEEKCTVRTDFQRDRDRIIHSKTFRRLKHKTQVFIAPEGDHYRTRLTHTLEVSQIARTIARAIRMNEDLTEAIALGHDLGHTPFGHTGEKVLDKISEAGFRHNEQSLRVVEVLEGNSGLNLTDEVRNGILCHSGELEAYTLEGRIVKLADKIAYINHDIDDSIRAGVINIDDIPDKFLDVLGKTHSQRINNLIISVINFFIKTGSIGLQEQTGEAFWNLRKFMFEHVYIGSSAKKEEAKAMNCIEQLYFHFLKNPDKMPEEFIERINIYGKDKVVCDYIAGMTDRYAMSEFLDIFVPMPWKKIY